MIIGKGCYGLMLLGSVAVFVAIRSIGESLHAPIGSGPQTSQPGSVIGFLQPQSNAADSHADVLVHVLIAIIVVTLVARCMGELFRRLHQPPVMGEVMAGVLLGPSLLGHVAPGAFNLVFPGLVVPFLGVISQVGIILYMFLVGLDLDLADLRQSGRSSVFIGHASMMAPFLLGSAMALVLFQDLSGSGVTFTTFALFLGIALSVTAFPVLARILSDLGASRSRMGATALSCAAVNDVTAWCLLAFVAGVARAQIRGAFLTILLTAFYLTLMLFVVRPVITRLRIFQDPEAPRDQSTLAIVLSGLLISTLATEVIGVHAIFGAFLAGAVIPRQSPIARDLTRRLGDPVAVLLLPSYFVFTGLRTEIGLLHGAAQWTVCGLIVLVATVGKAGGTFLAARLVGFSRGDASVLGVLMNTRGLMELVVLNVGMDLGVISPLLFAMLVLMALVTTLSTAPALHLIGHRHPWGAEPLAAA